jgi:hypothetical protein
MAWCDKNTYDLKLLLFAFGLDFLNKIFWKYSPSSYMFCMPYLYMITSMYIHITYINARIHQGLNPKLEEVHQGLQHQTTLRNEMKIQVYYLWHETIFLNSNFNMHFLYQDLFKCYKWKHNLEAYSIIYWWKHL